MNKKTLLTILQVALTVGILAFLFRDAEKNRLMLAALSHADLGWIAAAIGVFGIVELAAIIRWQILLRVQGIRIGWGRLASLFMIGILFNPFMPERMPLRDQLVDLSVAYNQYGRAWGSSLLALLLCVPVHLGSFTLFYCVGKAFAESAQRASLLDFWGIMPIVNTIASVPISIGGTGIREGLFIKLLGGLCQISEATAMTISLTGYAVLIFWSLVGGVIYLCYRPTEHARLGEMNREVAQLEHEIAEKAE